VAYGEPSAQRGGRVRPKTGKNPSDLVGGTWGAACVGLGRWTAKISLMPTIKQTNVGVRKRKGCEDPPG